MNIPYLDLKAITALHANEIRQAVAHVVDSGWYLQGTALKAFEEHYASYIGTRHCVGVANGLDALTLTLRAYIELGRMTPGAEVLVPANTFLATVLAITDNGLRPVFVDVDEDSLEMSVGHIEEAMTERTAALMLVHLYGRNTYNDALGRMCKERGLLLIEDNAQAHGCLSGTRRTGSLGDAACHSFYPGKNLGALGDGGAVTTDDTELAQTIRTIANYGFGRRYYASLQGRNSRLDEVQAAVLDVKLSHLDEDNRRREDIARTYYDNISNPAIRLPRRMADGQNVFHIFPVFCQRRDELQKHLAQAGIQTLIHYPVPPHKQECYETYNHIHLPVTERLAQQELSIPLNQAMSDAETAYIIEEINRF